MQRLSQGAWFENMNLPVAGPQAGDEARAQQRGFTAAGRADEGKKTGLAEAIYELVAEFFTAEVDFFVGFGEVGQAFIRGFAGRRRQILNIIRLDDNIAILIAPWPIATPVASLISPTSTVPPLCWAYSAVWRSCGSVPVVT